MHATLQSGYLKGLIKTFPQSNTIVLFEGRELIGWAVPHPLGVETAIFLFVKAKYRKLGCGQLLIEEGIKDYGAIVLYKHDDRTNKLFNKLKNKYPSRVKVLSWWKYRFKYQKMIETKGKKIPT